MIFGFLDRNFVLVFLAFVVVFFVFGPLNFGAELISSKLLVDGLGRPVLDSQGKQLFFCEKGYSLDSSNSGNCLKNSLLPLIQNKAVIFVAFFVFVYFILPNLSRWFGRSDLADLQITAKDLEDEEKLLPELKEALGKQGFFEFFSGGYRLTWMQFRKPYGLAEVWLAGTQKYFFIFDGLKNSSKRFIAGAGTQQELLRLFGVKNLKELGDVLVLRREPMSRKEWELYGKEKFDVAVITGK